MFKHAASDGEAFNFHGAHVVIKVSGAQTEGQLAVMESTYPPGLSVPAHFHAGEDEMLYVLDGELHGYCDDERWTATPGTFVFVRRDRPHGFTVIGDEPARALVIVGPARLDGQVARVARDGCAPDRRSRRMASPEHGRVVDRAESGAGASGRGEDDIDRVTRPAQSATSAIGCSRSGRSVE